MQHISPFPIDTWSADMQAATEQICTVGSQLLARHRTSSHQADEAAKQWRLEERLEEERIALEQLFDGARCIIDALEQTRALFHTAHANDQLRCSIVTSAQAIEDNLPTIERAFVTIRHCALDLLQWTQRSGHVEGSGLPAEYRSSYAKLIEYAPAFKPRLACMQHELLTLTKSPGEHKEAERLRAALTQYNGVVESARSFVKSVVEPPLELVFHDTEHFHVDWRKYNAAHQARLATEFNDCCQLLLYDRTAFERAVEQINPQLPGGIEASLCIFSVDEIRVLFTVDEDPVFEQVTITLLRIVPLDGLKSACDNVTVLLYDGLSGE